MGLFGKGLNEINEVYVLVHPLYDLLWMELMHPGARKSISKQKMIKGLKVLKGLWGRAVITAASNPKAAFVLMNPLDPLKKLKIVPAIEARQKKVFEWQAEKLIEFARKKLEGRFLVVEHEFDFTGFQPLLAKKGFRLGKQPEFKVFGEYANYCVKDSMNAIGRNIKIKLVFWGGPKIFKLDKLSLENHYAEKLARKPRSMRKRLR